MAKRPERRGKAEDPTQLKAEFVARVSHEVRTPLHGIVGMTNLLMQTELNGEQQEYLDAIKASADRLHTLLADILDFTRVESGAPVFEEIPFSPAITVTAVADSFRTVARDKGLRLGVLVSDRVPTLVRGDPARLRQILTNLVDNAIKFTDDGEIRVVVTTGREIEGVAELTVAVRDTGQGIEEERLEDIFESFTQLDGSMTRLQGGTGLGLAIVKRLVERMGGQIHVDSRPGAGSEFRFVLRMPTVEPDGDRLKRVPLDRLVDLAVLLVDENATSRRIIAQALIQAGLRVQVATDAAGGREAIQVAESRSDPFAIALIDIETGGGGGFGLAEHIQEASEGSTATIMLSAAGQRGDAVRCRKHGVGGYLVKPIESIEIIDAVRVVLGFGNKRYRELVTRHLLRESAGFAVRPVQAPVQTIAIDRSQLLARMGGDESLMRELAGMFLKESPRRLADLEDAIDRLDLDNVTLRARKLRGALGSLAAEAAYVAASELERAGRDGCRDDLDPTFLRLKSQIDLVRQDLQILLRSEQAL